MKTLFVNDLINKVELGSEIILLGWVKACRDHGQISFIDICDSTGSIQVVVPKDQMPSKNPVECSVRITGLVIENSNFREIRASRVEIIGTADYQLSPRPRSDFDIFDPSLADHLLRNRHLYLRNEKTMAILKFRHIVMGAINSWFRDNNFIEIAAPVLTTVPLYEDGSAISFQLQDQNVFLTQCVGFYLESAVHAFEKVYNIGPSFRGEESRSKRHLMEYWHIKAEVAFGDLEDIIGIVENLIREVTSTCSKQAGGLGKILDKEICIDGLKTPFPRINYREALKELQKGGFNLEFGKSLGSEEEEFLSRGFQTPFWVTKIPRKIEPFPYVIDDQDSEVTMTADLIASNGYGELLGVAEKTSELDMLIERLEEKGKLNDPRYEWLKELRMYGSVPHIGFGMGVERFIRWLLNIPHVRDAIPFPRTFRRRVYP